MNPDSDVEEGDANGRVDNALFCQVLARVEAHPRNVRTFQNSNIGDGNPANASFVNASSGNEESSASAVSDREEEEA